MPYHIMQQYRTFCLFSILENIEFAIKIYSNLLQINYGTKKFFNTNRQLQRKNRKEILKTWMLYHTTIPKVYTKAPCSKNRTLLYVERSPYTMYGDPYTHHYLFSEKALLLNDNRPADANHKYNDHQQIWEHLTGTNSATC